MDSSENKGLLFPTAHFGILSEHPSCQFSPDSSLPDPLRFEPLPPLNIELALNPVECNIHVPDHTNLINPSDEKSKKTRQKERNRLCARECRRRKRERIEALESRVRELKAELANCRTRLEKYELIERKCDMRSYAIVCATALQEKAGAAKEADFSSIIIKKFDQMFEERRQALERLAHTIVEVAIPVPIRLVLWEMEHDFDAFDPQSIDKVAGGRLNPDDIKEAIKNARALFPEEKNYYAMKRFISASTPKIRNCVRQLLMCQREIQTETQKVWEYLKKNVMPRYSQAKALHDMRLAPKLQDNPELHDYAFFRLTEDDFSFGTDASE